MTYKGYTIKLDLKNKKVRFFNDSDDCVFNLFNQNVKLTHIENSTIAHIENLARKAINDRINYLQKNN